MASRKKMGVPSNTMNTPMGKAYTNAKKGVRNAMSGTTPMPINPSDRKASGNKMSPRLPSAPMTPKSPKPMKQAPVGMKQPKKPRGK